MPFIDWTGSGDPFDPTNIAISVAMESDDDEVNVDKTPSPEVKQKSGCGCLTATLTFAGFITVIVFTMIDESIHNRR